MLSVCQRKHVKHLAVHHSFIWVFINFESMTQMLAWIELHRWGSDLMDMFACHTSTGVTLGSTFRDKPATIDILLFLTQLHPLLSFFDATNSRFPAQPIVPVSSLLVLLHRVLPQGLYPSFTSVLKKPRC